MRPPEVAELVAGQTRGVMAVAPDHVASGAQRIEHGLLNAFHGREKQRIHVVVVEGSERARRSVSFGWDTVAGVFSRTR